MFSKQSFCNRSSCPRTSVNGKKKKVPKKRYHFYRAIFGTCTGVLVQDDQSQKDSVQTIYECKMVSKSLPRSGQKLPHLKKVFEMPLCLKIMSKCL